MLRFAKSIGRLPKLSVHLHKAPNLTALSTVHHIRLKHSNVNNEKSGRTLKPEECTPQNDKTNKQASVRDDSSFTCPPECEETCNIPRSDRSNGPPCGGGSSLENLIAYWKEILAAVLLTGVTIYMVNKYYVNDSQTSKIGEHSHKEKKVLTGKQKKEVSKNPNSSSVIPTEIPYLLVGGGTAAFSAFRSIKSKDPTAKVLVITAEESLPYMRPPLSKELWYNNENNYPKSLTFKQWNGGKRSLFYEPKEFFTDIKDLSESEKGGISVATGWKITSIDAANKTAILEDGYKIRYDKCLIATGASPKTLPVFNSATDAVKNKIIHFRTVEDFLQLEDNIKKPGVRNIVIVGGGFLGSELACSLARNVDKNQKILYQLVKEKSVLAQVLPEYLSEWLTKKLHTEGVHCIPNVEIEDYEYKNGKLRIILTGGQTIEADQVVVAVGVDPNTELSESSQLETDPEIGGFLVNAELQARKDLWVAGDVACFYDVQLGRRRVEHHDHAVVSGRLAGENMTGAGKPYIHQSMFWSDLGPDIGFEAIGIVDSSLPTVGVFAINSELEENKEKKEESKTVENKMEHKSSGELTTVNTPVKSETPLKKIDNYGKGVIFYLRDNTIVGIVLWNIYNRMAIARQVLAQGKHYEDLNEVAKLFAIHED